MAEFIMPTLGADMSAGTLVAWKKKPGDYVRRGEIIAEVDTEKAAIEIEVFTSGVIEKTLVQPGEKVPVGTVLAIIREEGQPATTTVFPTPPVSPTPSAATVPMPLAKKLILDVETGRLRISPSARQLATELGVDPATVTGTGSEGAITRLDIEQAARRKAPTRPVIERVVQPEGAVDKQARMRQAIAAAMARSKREIPHYT
jgi:pyruvate dehydrogenase E2 component (dihydrolipoamide acetyltransferase)